jgi:hypothetical protein
MEHFAQEELIEMKYLVIKLHLQQRKHNSEDVKINIKKTNINEKPTMNSLPNEILMKIFSNLNQRELLNVARVSRSWNILSYDPLQWTRLSFVEWINMSSKKNRDFNLINFKQSLLFYR